ncbi:MAG: hypothetical protein QM478_04585 [Flavobacteriaceae bacterium]
MNKFYYLILLVTTISCISNRNDQNTFIDYVKAPINDFSIIREYKLENNTLDASVFSQQYLKKINDTTYELKYIWKRSDLILINKGVEKYYSNNYGEIISQSFFEIDSMNKVSEVNAEFLSQTTFGLSNHTNEIDMQYKFKNDSNLTMLIHSEVNFKISEADTLGILNKKCLVVKSEDTITLKYSDEREDIITISKGIRYYEKGKGLIFFAQNDGNSNMFYRLKE